MAKNEKNYYKDALAKSVLYAYDSALLLKSSLDNFSVHKLQTQLNNMHQIENAADMLKHTIMDRLIKEFLPPINREDIATLSQAIDKVTNTVEEVLQGIYMFHITAVHTEVTEYSQLILQCLAVLKDMIPEMFHFRKTTSLQKKIIQINCLEEEGNQLYTKAMFRLYNTKNDPLTVLSWTSIYDRLEKCCNACEEVANLVAWIVMKNN